MSYAAPYAAYRLVMIVRDEDRSGKAKRVRLNLYLENKKPGYFFISCMNIQFFSSAFSK
jgi:hypothetical protein